MYCLADLKALLARLGVDLAPDARMVFRRWHTFTSIRMVHQVRGYTPTYVVYGFVACSHCTKLCYLGKDGRDSVLRGITPVCVQCVPKLERS